jgi:hypothetical protein
MGQHLDGDREEELEKERQKLTPKQKLQLMNELRNVEYEMRIQADNADRLKDKQEKAIKELPEIEKAYKEALKRYEECKKIANNQKEIDEKWENWYKLETRELELFVLLEGELDANVKPKVAKKWIEG